MRVISEGTPKRFGGPQYPMPRLTLTSDQFNDQVIEVSPSKTIVSTTRLSVPLLDL